MAIIYISHRLDEVEQVAQRITVLRDGKTVGTENTTALTVGKVISLMVGREVDDIFPETSHKFGEVALEVKNLTTFDADVTDKNWLTEFRFR